MNANLINLRLDEAGKAVITDSTGEPLHGVLAVTLRIERNKPVGAVVTLDALDVIVQGVPGGIDRDQLVQDLRSCAIQLQAEGNRLLTINGNLMEAHTRLSAQVATLTAERDALQAEIEKAPKL